MQQQQKLGYGFIGFGILLIIGLYFTLDGAGYAFSALLGLMAVIFGGMQILLAKPLVTKSSKPAAQRPKQKRARR
jgi:hypothetical protein